MNVMQLAGKFLGEKVSRIYEKFKIHTDDRSIHRTSAEIRAEITEEDIPSEIARRAEVEQSLAGKVDRVDGKELMPSPGETPRRDRFLNEQGEYVPLDSHYLVLDATMAGEKEFVVDQEQLQEYIDRTIVGGDNELSVLFKFVTEGWNEYYKVTLVMHRTGSLGNSYLIATHPITLADGRQGMREYRYNFFYDVAKEGVFIRGKGIFSDTGFYTSSYIDTLLEAKADAASLQAHAEDALNPHRVTKAQVGLAHVDDTADADKPVSKAVQQALDGVSGELQSHVSDTDVHKTSAQIRAEITEADIPDGIARDAEVGAKIQAHDESGEAHADLRNALKNLESGAVKAGSAEYTGKLGTEADSYTKIQLDAKLNRHIKDVVYDAEQARFTFVFEDGREIVVDTPLENTVTDGRYDNETLELVLVLVSGQEIRIPVAEMTKVYTGKDTATATTTVSRAGEISVAVKPGSVDAVHLSSALLAAIDSHLTLTGDTKDNIATFADQATRTNLASGDKHALLFGKIKRWFTDLKALAFKDKAGKADLDTALQAEIDGKANTVHTHAKSQITDFPAALPANGGNADSVGGYPVGLLGRIESSNITNIDDTPGFWTSGYSPNTKGTKPTEYYGVVLQTCNVNRSPLVGEQVWLFQIAHAHGYDFPWWRSKYNNNAWTTWKRVALYDDVLSAIAGKLSHISDIMDANNVSENGAGRTGAATINIPTTGLGGYLVNYIWDINASHQMFFSLDPSCCFTRIKIGGEWQEWKQLALAGDIPAWAKAATKPSYQFNEISDATDVVIHLDQITRRVIDCHSKANQGYRSRAAIGLLNNSGFSYPIISAGLDDNGTQWADWKFRHTDGRIIAPNNKYFAFDDDVLKNTGDQVLNNGRLSITVSAPEHVFYYINGVDNSKLGYVGFGGFPDGSLHIMNYAVNKYLNLSIDGKLYYDQKELAFKSDIGSGDNYYPTVMNWTSDKGYGPRLNLSGVGMAALSATIPLASVNESGVVNTIAQTFAGKKTFNAGVDVSAGGMNVNGGMAVTNGAISCTHEISAANGFYETSDVRLKKNITSVYLSGERIRLCEFDKSGRHGYGVIAQEVEKLYPAAVKEENGYKVVNYTEILTIKCAEQDERIEALESENTSLKERLERLEKLLLQ